jgi:hypothetical protein
MKRRIRIAGATLMVAAGLTAAVAAPALGADRPLSGHYSGTTLLNPVNGTLTSDATGVSSLVGKSSVRLDGMLTPTSPLGFNVAGSIVLVAANGDELHGTLIGSGTADSSTGNSQGTSVTTFTGGTGRFANASGTAGGPFTQTLISNPPGGTWTYTTDFSLSGTISY